ncbi:hypothetical protein Tco_0441767 [Tanacetum coccineum]
MSTTKLPILKKGEYNIWAMKMEHYLTHIDYPIWEVIQRGNGPVSVSTDTNGVIKVLPPKTAEEILAREKERKVRTTLLMALPEDHLAKFHKMNDAKVMWDDIKSRFGGNDESKKMQKYILKQQFEGFSISNLEGLHKGYDRFQSLLSQFEIHSAGVSTEDANQKFLRVFVSSESTNNTNDVSTSYSVSTSSSYNSQKEGSSSYTDELKSFTRRLEEGCSLMPRNQLALTRPRLNASIAITHGTLLESVDQKEIKKAKGEMQGILDIKQKIMGGDLENRRNLNLWSCDVKDSHVHDRFENVEGMHAIPPPLIGNYMPSGPDREVDDSMFTYGPKQSKTSESDSQTSNFDSCESNSKVETLESVLEPVVVEPKVVSQPKVLTDAPIIKKYELDSDDEYVIQPSKEQERPSFAFVNTVKHVKTPRETVKEQNTYSPSPKADKRDWNGPDREVDDSMFTYGPKQSKTSESDNQTSNFDSCESISNVETLESVLEPVVVEPKVVSQPKVWSDAPMIKEYESDSDDEYVIQPSKEQERPSFAFVNTVKHVKTPRETAVKPSTGCSWRPKRHYWNKVSKYNSGSSFSKNDNPHKTLKNKGIVDSGCSRHMTGNKAYLAEYQNYNGGLVAFGELHHFNLFSVSQMCDKKNKVLFTDTECLVLSSDFKLPDENQVLLRIPRQNNMYSFNIENIVPSGGLACSIAKATVDESNK